MNKSLNILKEITSNTNIKGKISLRNDGRFLARMEVHYQLGNEDLCQISGRIYEGQQYSLFIPDMATNIRVVAQELILGTPEIWHTIFSVDYPYAEDRAFRLWGNSLDAKYRTEKPKQHINSKLEVKNNT